jgi:hypothetical protein
MARIFMDGGELLRTDGFNLREQSGLPPPTVNFDQTVKRGGVASFALGAAATIGLGVFFGVSYSALYLKVAFKFDRLIDPKPWIGILSAGNGSGWGPTVAYNGIGSFGLFAGCRYNYNLAYTPVQTMWGAGSTVFDLNAWHIVELFVDGANGQAILKVDGVTQAARTGGLGSGFTSFDRFMFGIGNLGYGGGASAWFDDIAVNDTSGPTENSWCGPGGVYLLKPNADQSPLEWSPSAGTTHYALVNETPVNINDYIYAETPGTADRFGLSDLPPQAREVRAVQPIGYFALTESGEAWVRMRLVSGSSSHDAGTAYLATVHPNAEHRRFAILSRSPFTGSAWTPEEVNGLSLQVEIA